MSEHNSLMKLHWIHTPKVCIKVSTATLCDNAYRQIRWTVRTQRDGLLMHIKGVAPLKSLSQGDPTKILENIETFRSFSSCRPWFASWPSFLVTLSLSIICLSTWLSTSGHANVRGLMAKTARQKSPSMMMTRRNFLHVIPNISLAIDEFVPRGL